MGRLYLYLILLGGLPLPGPKIVLGGSDNSSSFFPLCQTCNLILLKSYCLHFTCYSITEGNVYSCKNLCYISGIWKYKDDFIESHINFQLAQWEGLDVVATTWPQAIRSWYLICYCLQQQVSARHITNKTYPDKWNQTLWGKKIRLRVDLSVEWIEEFSYKISLSGITLLQLMYCYSHALLNDRDTFWEKHC